MKIIKFKKLSEKELEELLEEYSDNNKASLLADVFGGGGDEVLAYYEKDKIYVKKRGIVNIVKRFKEIAKEKNIELSNMDAQDLAIKKLMIHEQTHHAIKKMVKKYEMKNVVFDIYKEFNKDEAYHLHEEAICNSNVIIKLKNKISKDKLSIIEEFQKRQPVGYNNYGKFLNKPYSKNIAKEICLSILQIKKVKNNKTRQDNKTTSEQFEECIKILSKEFRNITTKKVLDKIPKFRVDESWDEISKTFQN